MDEVKIDLIQQAVKSNAIPVTITSKSTQQYGQPSITTVTNVAPGSDLTITVKAWTDQPLKIQIGESKPIEMDYSSGVHTYTVQNITNPLEIQIITDGYNVSTPAVSGYTEPYFEPVGEETVYGTATLNEGNNWTCQWSDLPKEDSNGNRYYYHVQEVTEVPGFHVTYSRNNADGVQAGELVVINQASGYVLPETGGPGTRKIAAAARCCSCCPRRGSCCAPPACGGSAAPDRALPQKIPPLFPPFPRRFPYLHHKRKEASQR